MLISGFRAQFHLAGSTNDRLPSLDGFRGISLFVVLMCHATISNYASPQLQSISPLFNGMTVIRVFYVISGFLITGLLIKERAQNGRISLGAFYFRRFFRLFPVQFTYVMLLILITVTSKLHVHACAIITDLTYTKNYASNACVAEPDGHFWTLSVEEQFYLLWALAFITLSKRLLLFIAGLLILIAPVSRAIQYHGGNHNWWWLTSNADALMVGCLTAIFFEQPWVIRVASCRPAAGRVAALILIAIPIIMSNLMILGIFTVTLGPLIQAICISYLVCSCLIYKRGLMYVALNSRPLVFMGTISYSVYIFQQIFFYTTSSEYGLPDSFLFHFPANLIVAFCVGLLVFYGVERPMMRFRKFLSRPRSTALMGDRLDDHSNRSAGMKPHVSSAP